MENIIFVIGIIILFIMCIIFIYLYTHAKYSLIPPKLCPKISAEFGVLSNTVGNDTISVCGKKSNELCIFENIATLEDAITICHENAKICNAFSYTRTGVMNIINYSNGVLTSNTFDTYIQQFGVN